jgi:hypothetical protein
LQQLQQFVSGTFAPTDDHLLQLARHIGIPEASSNG